MAVASEHSGAGPDDSIEATIAALRHREATLTKKIEALTRERTRVRSALAGLHHLAAPASSSSRPLARSRSREIVQAYATHLGPNQPIKLLALLAWALDHGWHTSAIDQRTALSCALVRAAEQGYIRRDGRATYFTHDAPVDVP